MKKLTFLFMLTVHLNAQEIITLEYDNKGMNYKKI